jgi:hypothetical protein
MPNQEAEIIKLASREASLKRKLRRHLKGIGFSKSPDGQLVVEGQGKDIVRSLHSVQRKERLEASRDFLRLKAPKLFAYFARGKDVDPERIEPVLERISADTWQGNLFRLASLTWSVPVSNGYGRRIRYLVWDSRNGKLIGLIAIGDPVLNLGVRDRLIGWDVHERAKRLVNVMDAYVLGAVPPYNALLGGKLVACLVRSRDIYDDFARIYGSSTGIISQQDKRARLLAVTTSSSMGRSSVYNRLKLDGLEYFRPIGYTGGWGHFHIPDRLFAELRDYLRDSGHSYADLHRFGQGPNWRMRTTRAALNSLGFAEDMLRHGIQREVFLCTLASNAAHILKSGKGQPDLESLRPVQEIAELAVERWIAPRASRRPEYRTWTADRLLEALGGHGRAIREVLSRAI